MQFSDSPIIESGLFLDPSLTDLTTPVLAWIGQASGMVVAVVQPPDVITAPISTYTLYRAATPAGPWILVDTRRPAALCRWVNLFDSTPSYGQRMYYSAAIDGPRQSNTLYFVATANPTPIGPGGTLSAGAFGPYPLLGSDVYLDAVSGEAAIGPNGDLLAVNGLELLAQDLRTRFLTNQGELLLHPQFGLSRQRVIGSGQADPQLQAQQLQARFIDAITGDPRVLSVQSLTISLVGWDTWLIDFTIIAIGSEDAQRLNIVFPYFAA